MKSPKLLVVPVEVKAREFVAKIFFACAAAERGYEVVVGERQRLYADIIPVERPGLIVEHDVTAAHRTSFPWMKRLGHKIVAWDEEVIAQPSGAWYVSRRICADVVEMVEGYLAWGEEQVKWITDAHPHLSGKLVVTGNPRIDILRPELSPYFQPEAQGYMQRFGRYILINSNFNRVNLFHGERAAFIESVARSAGLSDNWKSYYRSFIEHSEKTFKAYVDILPQLSVRFPQFQIVIRPHPAENPEPWHKAVESLPNVHVLYEGTANALVLGAAALVHSGCTTAVEAAILGVPVIEYAPIDSTDLFLPLPRAVSQCADNPAALFELLVDVLSSQSPSQFGERALKHSIHAVQGPLATENILDFLSTLEPDRGDVVFRFIKRSRALARRIIGKAKRPETSGVRYARHKFPDTPLEEIQRVVSSFSTISGRFKRVKIDQIADNCFRIRCI